MTTPAGWYDDGSGNRRWWDGLQWTEHVVTGAPPTPTASATAEPIESAAAEPTGTATTEPAEAEQDQAASPVAADPDPAPFASPAPEAAPFAPPYMMPSQAEYAHAGTAAANPVGGYPGGTGYPAGAGYPQSGVAGGAPWPSPPAQPPHSGMPVVGIIGLAVVVVGVVCACIPAISIVGWALLAVGFVTSLVSLFLRGRKWPGIVGLAVAVVGAILALAVSFITLATTSSAEGDGWSIAVPSEQPPTDEEPSPEANEDPSAIEGAEMVPFGELEVGDCLPLVEYGDEDQIFDLPVVPCEQPHTDEISLIFDVEDGEFPGDDALAETAWQGCVAHFETFVGIPYEESMLDLYTYQPTRGSWSRADDRTVYCIVFSYEDVTGTLQGANY
ncbi:DUF2510 domain-containing protein [Microbacterium sp. MYb62]|uniref:DUF2510 domain-containing protein n=1 Tax=Microbacterium sp. MYb62 TaxID=1848690 RepID=UPI000CFB22CE|nr:DUF2510 domain-containing protein [Microbacterium sp. MYb62]PRB10404.1 hypothetical protein CQ042_17840 [Microbacterium sp. MYb62]